MSIKEHEYIKSRNVLVVSDRKNYEYQANMHTFERWAQFLANPVPSYVKII